MTVTKMDRTQLVSQKQTNPDENMLVTVGNR
jgi:hypothetical protein